MPASLLDTWNRLSMAQRAGLGAVLTAVFGGILAVALFGSRPNYGVLYANLEPEAAGSVTAKLRDLKVDYRLEGGGRTIEVPQDKVYDLRNTLAAQGLPTGGIVGFEIFDKPSFGATDFTQRLNYQRALQGELERTIGHLDGVDAARVHLAIPEKRLFEQQQEPSTASVILHLRSGYQVPEAQVAGILHLVASAVEGLKTENVSVHDAQGELLSGDQGRGSTLTGNQLQIQEQYERRLSNQLTQLAETVLGAGKAAVRVSADLNWDSTETDTETYRGAGKSGKGIPIEETLSTETYDKSNPPATAAAPAAPPTGTVGTSGNVGATPAGGVSPEGARPGQYLNSHSTNRYAVDKIVEKKTTAPGKVRRVSVAVLLDGKIDAAQQKALKDAFSAAAGLDLAAGGRGDRIELLPLAFDHSAEAEATKTGEKDAKQQARTTLYRNIAAGAVGILIALVTLILGLKTMAPRRRPLDAVIADEKPEPAAAPATYTSTGVAPPPAPAPAPAPVPAGRAASEGLVLPPLEVARRLAHEQPEEVARQLAAWMQE